MSAAVSAFVLIICFFGMTRKWNWEAGRMSLKATKFWGEITKLSCDDYKSKQKSITSSSYSSTVSVVLLTISQKMQGMFLPLNDQTLGKITAKTAIVQVTIINTFVHFFNEAIWRNLTKEKKNLIRVAESSIFQEKSHHEQLKGAFTKFSVVRNGSWVQWFSPRVAQFRSWWGNSIILFLSKFWMKTKTFPDRRLIDSTHGRAAVARCCDEWNGQRHR